MKTGVKKPKKLKKTVKKSPRTGLKTHQPKRRSAATAGKKTKLTKAEAKNEVNQQAFAELIARGKSRGFVTDSEVLHFFPHNKENVGFLEQMYDDLAKAHIKVLETNQLIDVSKEEISQKELITETQTARNLL